MLKKIIFITVLLISITISGQKISKEAIQNDPIIANFMQLQGQKLYDTAKYFFDKNIVDSALIFYNLFITKSLKETDLEIQKRIIESYINSSVIHYNMCDYRTAYEYSIKALLLCEKVDYETYALLIYNNIGNIYHRFKKYDMAKKYFSEALNLSRDTSMIIVTLNNLGSCELGVDNLDSAYNILNKALQFNKIHFNLNSQIILINNLAYYHQKQNMYDSAFYYYNLSLNLAEKNKKDEYEAEILSNLGNMHFETNQLDSALFYFNLANTIAYRKSFSDILSRNYLVLSKIEESKGNIQRAFDYFKKHTNVRDSLLNIEVFNDINQFQRLYEVSKTNQQIENLLIEQQIKERTIYYQKIIWLITFAALVFVCVVLIFIYLQKKKINIAYKTLFEKNLEIVEFKGSVTQKNDTKFKSSSLSDEMENELLSKIFKILEDRSVISDPEFSLSKLAVMLQCNHLYVSQVVNDIIKKNFNLLLNEYRISEAQRLLSEPDAKKYTLEALALKAGYKSISTFHRVFKEITGLSPSFYLKSMQEKRKEEPCTKTETESVE